MSDESLEKRLVNEFLEKNFVQKRSPESDYAKAFIYCLSEISLGGALTYFGDLLFKTGDSMIGLGMCFASLAVYGVALYTMYHTLAKSGE
jgi:hypothetical protein